MTRLHRRVGAFIAGVALMTSLTVVVCTRWASRPVPGLASVTAEADVRARLLDRHGAPIAVTYDGRWNVHDVVPLHEIPPLLRQAVITAEDRRFHAHRGVDWRARLHAVVQNLRARRAVRGASTISEQVVRLLHPRSRSVWTRWVEGAEAGDLERRHSKGEILEFYLNQVPFARQRRGVVQAARDYFDRDLDTLAAREMLALAVLVRSPSRLDLRRGPVSGYFDDTVDRLAGRLHAQGFLTDQALAGVRSARLELREPALEVRAPHFVRFVRGELGTDATGGTSVRTTLDGSLQQRLEAVLEGRLSDLGDQGVSDGAVLAVDHRTNEVLAWVNAGGYSTNREASHIDAILTARQPGSTLKPFLYALALEQGWTAATLLDDSPFAGRVGPGLHRFRNYSRRYYGPIRLREALGNSLNIPAIRTIREMTPVAFHRLLRELGMSSLDRHPDEYGEGLALGNGEVTLHALVGAFATLARGGQREPLRSVLDPSRPPRSARRVLDEETASVIANILADPGAREREFGSGGVLDFPVETAVKTGTSNDYRDAWAVGFSDRHTVGVWMGNLDRREMDGVSGSVGPALVLRAAFAELRRHVDARPLFLSRTLRRLPICRESGASARPECPTVHEWFRPEHTPDRLCAMHGAAPPAASPARRADSRAPAVRWLRPTQGLHLARDPRIPDDVEAFAFELASADQPDRVEWFVDGVLVATTDDVRYLWPLTPGRHTAQARLFGGTPTLPAETTLVDFVVK